MGATVEQVEIDGMFYCNHTIFKLIARCHCVIVIIYTCISKNMGATVEQDEIDGMFYLTM